MPERLDGDAGPDRRGAHLPLRRVRSAPQRRTGNSVPFAGSLARQRDLDHAVNGLRRTRPELSAGEPAWLWQKWTLALLLPLLAAAAVLSLEHAIFALAAVLVLPFFCVVTLRCAALWHMAVRPRAPPEPIALETPSALPRYSLLIPLFDEAAIVPDLIAALRAIDYPADRFEAFLILEEVDAHTRAAIGAMHLPPNIAVVVVPAGEPRTKPRALNYALRRATGDLIVVYDAEDMPEPDQLRRAAKLLASGPRLGCVQARLNVLNANETWLTRQFAIEYTALFDCLLPTLEHLNLPVPLGGTSNHFPRRVLEEVGGWDPFNVTEDADLGIRLARGGWTVKVVDSTTWEEAPANFSTWRKQRTRWLKGWMQTTTLKIYV